MSTFQLAFHLPYFASRSSQKPCEDHRQYANGNRLRCSQDVSFLNWRTSGSSDFLYEAQISCLVAGSDERRWVAYCFVETYFDAFEEKRETVKSYHEESVASDGTRMDPFTKGQTSVEYPMLNPREYFLVVFRYRLHQFCREWQRLVDKINQSVREYEQVCHLFLSDLGVDDSNATKLFEPLVDMESKHGYVEKAVIEDIIASSILQIHLEFIFRDFLVY